VARLEGAPNTQSRSALYSRTSSQQRLSPPPGTSATSTHIHNALRKKHLAAANDEVSMGLIKKQVALGLKNPNAAWKL
jgi:hypothetical protein